MTPILHEVSIFISVIHKRKTLHDQYHHEHTGLQANFTHREEEYDSSIYLQIKKLLRYRRIIISSV